MDLLLKDDWESAQAMYRKWWRRENHDRPLLLIDAPRPEPLYSVVTPPAPKDPEEMWMNAEYRVRSWEKHAVSTYFGGDSFPYFDPQIGPGSLALYLGAIPGFDWGTVWYHRSMDLGTAALPEFNAEHPIWLGQLELIRAGLSLKGKALTSFPDIIEGIDILSALAGAMETLFALMDSPQRVHEFIARIDELYPMYYESMYDLIRDEDGGSCFSAFKIWGPGRTAKVQCDFSAMIGPDMFEEFVAPYLTRQCEKLDNVMYHLDGPECICHAGIIGRIPGIDIVQWTPGDGKPSLADPCWMPLFETIRGAGKGLALYGVSIEQAKWITRELGPEGLLLSMSVPSPEAADAIVADSYSWK